MNGTIEIRCRQCGEVIGIVTDEIEPSTEAIIRETPVHCFFCHRLTLHRGEPVERRMPYRDE